MDDNQQRIIRNEETVVAGQPEAERATVQTATTTTPPSEQVVARNVAERVEDPAAEKAAAVDWVNRLVWFVAGLMCALIAIRFVLLLAGANESAGFAQLIYGLTNWMVAPFSGLFGSHITYPGSAGTAVFEPESLVAILVYVLLGWGVTKLAELLMGPNRTTGTVVQETKRQTKL